MRSDEKFTGRSAPYVKFRPSYPDAVLDAISERCPLNDRTMVADVGAGTGIFSGLLLERGATVISVEPNEEMRQAAGTYLRDYGNSLIVPGHGEKTGLVKRSLDLVTVAQAFHWMSPQETKIEFQRILKPGGFVALIWNERDVTTPFGKAYEEALDTYTEHTTHSHHTTVGTLGIESFYDPAGFDLLTFRNPQQLDLEGLLGRLDSTSYAPKPDDENYTPLRERVKEIVTNHAKNGEIIFDYDTRLYIGQLSDG